MTSTVPNAEPTADRLWANGRDSVRHALGHFSDRANTGSDRDHHSKWIVLSVHHAAECFCNAILLTADPKNSAFFSRGEVRFPSLSSTLRALRNPKAAALVSLAELSLLDLLADLGELRHQYMHRTAPEQSDVSLAAMCMLGLLKVAARRRGETTEQIFDQSPPVERDVLEAVHSLRLDPYTKFIESFLREGAGAFSLQDCPNCGATAVEGSRCEACFEDIEVLVCPVDGEEFLYSCWLGAIDGESVECPLCGGTHAT